MNYNLIKPKLSKFKLTNKPVFLRADLNVPIHDNQIQDVFRLKSIQPTLDYLLQHEAIVVLATHIGRPTHEEIKKSTQILIPWFVSNNYKIQFAPTIDTASSLIKNCPPSTIILLENLRFYPGEQNKDLEFAQTLKKLADYYINDAFGVLHRHDTSITILPELYDEEHKSIGFLVEKEIKNLSLIKDSPKRPYTIILGGGKAKDKLPIVEKLIEKCDTLLLCPQLSDAFIAAQSIESNKSKQYHINPIKNLSNNNNNYTDHELLDIAIKIIKKAKELKVNLVLPIDYQISENTFDGPYIEVKANELEKTQKIIAIGQNTIEYYSEFINKSDTIFFNSAMGFLNRPETTENLHKLLEIISSSQAQTFVGGGDSVAVVHKFGLTNKIDFCSTGGGSTLNFIAGNKLPGLDSILNQLLIKTN